MSGVMRSLSAIVLVLLIVSMSTLAQQAQELRAWALAQAQGVGNDGQRVFAFSGRKAKKEKAAFLGVVATAADPALRDQLKLQRGIGLVVQAVTDDSPASNAAYWSRTASQ